MCMRFQSQQPDAWWLCHCTDIPVPFGVRAEVTADNTSIRVSWQWSCQGVLDLVRVHYQLEGGSLMMYTMDNATSTSATLSNLQCNTEYTISVYASSGGINKTSASRLVSLPSRGMCMLCKPSYSTVYYRLFHCTIPAPPTPINVTARLMNASSVRVSWQWTSSGPAPNCFNTTSVTYHPEGGGESSLQLSDPAATETTLTDLQCNKLHHHCGGHCWRIQEGECNIPSTTRYGIVNSLRPGYVVITWCLSMCRSTEPLSSCTVSYLSTFNMGGPLPHTTIPHLLQGDMWSPC